MNLVLLVAGVLMLTAGISAYDYRAGLVFLGLVAVVAGLFLEDGEQ